MLSLDPTLPSVPPEGGADALPLGSEGSAGDAFETLLASLVGGEDQGASPDAPPFPVSLQPEGSLEDVVGAASPAHDQPGDATEDGPGSDSGAESSEFTDIWQVVPVAASLVIEPLPALGPTSSGEASFAVDEFAASIAAGSASSSEQTPPSTTDSSAFPALSAESLDEANAIANTPDAPTGASRQETQTSAAARTSDLAAGAAVAQAAATRASAVVRLAADSNGEPAGPANQVDAAAQAITDVPPPPALEREGGSAAPADRARAAAAFDKIQQHARPSWTDADAAGSAGSTGSRHGTRGQASTTPVELPTVVLRGDGRKAPAAVTVPPNASAPTAAAIQPLRAAEAAASTPSGEPTVESQIVQSLQTAWRGGSGEARLTLKPEYLGNITISVRVEQGAATAVLHVEEPQVRAWVQAHESVLRQGLSTQGLTLERLIVSDERHPADSRRRDDEPRRERRPRRSDTSDETPVFAISA